MEIEKEVISATVEKRKVGRPSKPDSLIFKTVGLTDQQWQYLEKWYPGSSPTTQLRELFNRAVKFWPSGPAKFR